MTEAFNPAIPRRHHAVSDLYIRLTARLAGFRLSNLARSVKRQKLTYLSDAKLLRLQNTLQQVATRQVNGAFIEFGVALGGSAILIANTATASHNSFHGFDVFGMIPPPASDKDDAKSKDRYDVIVSGQANGIGGELYYGYRDNLYAEVVEAFHRNGLAVDGRTVSLVKGLFADTWPQSNIASVAFCHIDCDWYEPVKFCLERVAPLLSPCGVILLDDFHDYGGCLRATSEFLKANPEFDLEDGPNVILRKRHEAARPH